MSSVFEPSDRMTSALTSAFCGKKRQGVFLLSLDPNASPSLGHTRYSFIFLAGVDFS